MLVYSGNFEIYTTKFKFQQPAYTKLAKSQSLSVCNTITLNPVIHAYQLLQVVTVVTFHRCKGHLHNLVDQNWEIGSLKSLLEAHHLIQDASQRPDV